MKTESAPLPEQPPESRLLQASGEMVKAVIHDEKVRRSARKVGERSLQAAGITHKSFLTRKTRFDAAGAREALAHPRATLSTALKKSTPQLAGLAFHAGRAAHGAKIDFNSANGVPTDTTPTVSEYAPSPYADTTAGTKPEQVIFNTTALPVTHLQHENMPAMAANQTTGVQEPTVPTPSVK